MRMACQGADAAGFCPSGAAIASTSIWRAHGDALCPGRIVHDGEEAAAVERLPVSRSA